ncbi:MAG: SIMPL domain-containing protein [Bryobacteraceae bacterium]
MRVYSSAIFLVAGLCAAQNTPGPPSVRASGEATVSERPDQARVQIGVVSQAPTAQAAAAQNAKQLSAVLDDLKKALGPEAQIRTTSYSIQPDYRYPRDGGKPTITGYTATNVVQVTLDDLTKVGTVIDTALKAGANTIRGIQFTLRDEQAARARALREATQEARANAQAMASALGLKTGRVLHLQQGEHMPIRPLQEYAVAAMRDAAAPPTPVEPGVIEVRATVTLTMEALP